MEIVLSHSSPVPLYSQLHQQIVAAIASGRLAPGTALHSVRTMALEFGINPATVKKAYDQLAAEGLVVTRPRAGTVVAERSAFTPEQANAVEKVVASAFTLGRAQGATHAQLEEIAHRALDAESNFGAAAVKETTC